MAISLPFYLYFFFQEKFNLFSIETVTQTVTIVGFDNFTCSFAYVLLCFSFCLGPKEIIFITQYHIM